MQNTKRESLAEKNKREFDEFIENENLDVSISAYESPYLWVRRIIGKRENEREIRRLLDRLTGSFSFEAVEMRLHRESIGFEITLPHIMIDFD